MKTPALAAWRRELARCERTREVFDPLWRAACEEANALEVEAGGLPGLAVVLQREARRIIVEAAKRQRGAV